MMDGHDLDWNDWCTRCGQSAMRIEDEQIPCVAPENLIPISSIVRTRRLLALVNYPKIGGR